MKIGWIAEKSPSGFCSQTTELRDEELIYYIMLEQYNLGISQECHLAIDNVEKPLAEYILDVHRNNVIRSYFLDVLSKDKVLMKFTPIEYYMFSLNSFLQKHSENAEYIFAKKIYKSREYIEKNHYNCQLTDFGKVYYKIYLITRLFCEKNIKITSYLGGINSKNIIEYLNTNKVEFVTF